MAGMRSMGIENDAGNGSPSSELSRREERRMQWEVGKPDKPLVEFGGIVEEGCGALVSSKEQENKKQNQRKPYQR